MNQVEIKSIEVKDNNLNAVEVTQDVHAMPQWSLRLSRDAAEMNAISNALDKAGWNRKRAARMLSISYRGLLYKIRRHNIAPPAKLS